MSSTYNLFIPPGEDRMIYSCNEEYCPARIHTNDRMALFEGRVIRPPFLFLSSLGVFCIPFFVPHIHCTSLFGMDPNLLPPFCQVVVRTHSLFRHYNKMVASMRVVESVGKTGEY